MDATTQDNVYEKIRELVFDEEKIVTCTSLAADQKISLSDAKTLLTAFVKDFPKDIHVTYVLSGILKNTPGFTVYLVKEECLAEKKAQFDTVYMELVYSIHKSNNIDLNVIGLIDKSIIESTTQSVDGLIVSKNCIKRTIKKNHIQTIKGDNPNDIKKVPSNNVTNSLKSGTLQSSQEKQQKGKQVGGIANYFTKASATINGSSQKENENMKLTGDLSLKIKDSNVILTEDTVINNKSRTDGDNKKVCDKIADEENIDSSLEHSKKMDLENVDSSLKPSPTKVTNKKRKKGTKVDNNPNKKRKRIQEICDSDSSDMFDDEKDEDIIERSDEEPEPTPVVQPTVLTKNKKRKAVDEVHMDEEGYMVTTTKYIYESASEDEDKQTVKAEPEEKSNVLEKRSSVTDSENDTKKPHFKGNKNKKASTGKQTTLMNFFKKN